ncbi:MAG: DUF6788 family protein [Planctomycetota bacterium]
MANTTLAHIERRIAAIKSELIAIGEMRPGSLSMQFNICGKAGCQCKHPDHPKKHGPYYQLSFVHRGKSTSQFIRAEFVPEIEQQIANYKRFKELTDEWVGLALRHARLKLELARKTAKSQA